MAKGDKASYYLDLPFFDKPKLRLPGVTDGEERYNPIYIPIRESIKNELAKTWAKYIYLHNVYPTDVRGYERSRNKTLYEKAITGDDDGFWKEYIEPALEAYNKEVIQSSTIPRLRNNQDGFISPPVPVSAKEHSEMEFWDRTNNTTFRIRGDYEFKPEERNYYLTPSHGRATKAFVNSLAPKLQKLIDNPKYFKIYNWAGSNYRSFSEEERDEYINVIIEHLEKHSKYSETQVNSIEKKLKVGYNRPDREGENTREKKIILLQIPNLFKDGSSLDLFVPLLGVLPKYKPQLLKNPELFIDLYQKDPQAFDRVIYPNNEKDNRIFKAYLALSRKLGAELVSVKPGSLPKTQFFTDPGKFDLEDAVGRQNLLHDNSVYARAQDKGKSPLKYLVDLSKKKTGDKIGKEYYIDNPNDVAVIKASVFNYENSPDQKDAISVNDNIKFRGTTINLRQSLAPYEKFENYYIDGNIYDIIERAEDGKLTKRDYKVLTLALAVDPSSQEIKRRSYGKRGKRTGFTYEHVTPISSIRALITFFIQERVKRGEIEKQAKDQEAILSNLHRVCILARFSDNLVDRFNKTTLSPSLLKLLGLKQDRTQKEVPISFDTPDGEGDIDEVLKRIQGITDEALFTRYTDLRIKSPVKITELFSSKNSEIALRGLTRKDFAVKTQTKRFEESKKPSINTVSLADIVLMDETFNL